MLKRTALFDAHQKLGAKLVDFSYQSELVPPQVVATYLTSEPFDAALERGIMNLLRSQVAHDVALEIRYVGPLPSPPKAKAEVQKRSRLR